MVKTDIQTGNRLNVCFFMVLMIAVIWGAIIAIFALTAEIAEYFGVIQWF